MVYMPTASTFHYNYMIVKSTFQFWFCLNIKGFTGLV